VFVQGAVNSDQLAVVTEYETGVVIELSCDEDEKGINGKL